MPLCVISTNAIIKSLKKTLKVSKRMPNINTCCLTLYVDLSDGSVLTGHMIGLLFLSPHMLFLSTP